MARASRPAIAQGIFGGLRLSRRTLLLVALGAVGTACTKAVSSVTGGPTSSSIASPPSPTAAASPTVAPRPSPVPAALRIPNDVLRSDAPALSGVWKGTWKSNDGSSGPYSLSVAIDVKGRSARLASSLGGGFFGPGSAPIDETIEFDLDYFPYMKPPYGGASDTVGQWTLTGLGHGFVQLDTEGIPGHPEIQTFHIKGYVFGPQVLPDGGLPFAYTITKSDGSAVKGTLVLRS